MTQQAQEALEQHYRHVDRDWEIKNRLLAGDTVAEIAHKTGRKEQDVRQVQLNIAIAIGAVKQVH